MFDIPETEILETHDEPRPGDDAVASLTYNQTERNLIRDGVDHIEIIPIDDVDGAGDEERYRINYMGYVLGSLTVTRAGLKAFGRSMLSSQPSVPHWLLSVEGGKDHPWWVPDSYSAPEPVSCANCGESVPVEEVITLGDRDEAEGYRCESCWRAER